MTLQGVGFETFVQAGSIAVVGASERNPIARITLDNLQRLGYPGRVVGDGARGRGLAADGVIGVCLTMLDLIAACGEHLDTVEINPLFVDDAEVIAVDSLVVPRG